jgi:hypothetical protein
MSSTDFLDQMYKLVYLDFDAHQIYHPWWRKFEVALIQLEQSLCPLIYQENPSQQLSSQFLDYNRKIE